MNTDTINSCPTIFGVNALLVFNVKVNFLCFHFFKISYTHIFIISYFSPRAEKFQK